MGLLDSNIVKNIPRAVAGTKTTSSFMSSLSVPTFSNPEKLQWMVFSVQVSPYSGESAKWDCNLYINSDLNSYSNILDRYGNVYKQNITHNGVYIIPTYGNDVTFQFASGDGTTSKTATFTYNFLSERPTIDIKPIQLIQKAEIAIPSSTSVLAFSPRDMMNYKFYFVDVRVYDGSSVKYTDIVLKAQFSNQGGAATKAETILEMSNVHSVVTDWLKVRGEGVDIYVQLPTGSGENVTAKVYIYGVR